MITNIYQKSPIYQAFSHDKDFFVRAITDAAIESAKNMPEDQVRSLFSMRDKMQEKQLKAA